MGQLYKQSHKFITESAGNGVFVEIGCERGEGSTKYFAELAQQYRTLLHAVDILPNAQDTVHHKSIVWHVSDGATWCQEQLPLLNQQVSLVYLDNFDFIYQQETIHNPLWTEELYSIIKGDSWPSLFAPFADMPEWVKQESMELLKTTESEIVGGISGRYKDFGFEFSNSVCQLEHLKQLLGLYPYFTNDCLVIFDDTFPMHDCWIGKNGPGVVFLQTQGFKILSAEDSGVIMKKES